MDVDESGAGAVVDTDAVSEKDRMVMAMAKDMEAAAHAPDADGVFPGENICSEGGEVVMRDRGDDEFDDDPGQPNPTRYAYFSVDHALQEGCTMWSPTEPGKSAVFATFVSDEFLDVVPRKTYNYADVIYVGPVHSTVAVFTTMISAQMGRMGKFPKGKCVAEGRAGRDGVPGQSKKMRVAEAD